MPTPFIDAHIDFDENWAFEDDEEIASDIQSAILTRGKDLQANRAPAATFTFAVKNSDHKYSPTNTASPLFPFQLPGPDVRLRMAYPYDALSGSAGVDLNGRNMPMAADQSQDDPDFGAWAGDSQFEHRSTHVECTTEGSFECVVDFGEANVRFGCEIYRDGSVTHSTFQSILNFRYTDTDNHNEIVLIDIGSGLLIIGASKTVAGVTTIIASGFTAAVTEDLWPEGTWAHVEAQIIEEELIVWVNDYLVLTVPSCTNQQTATKFGIGGDIISAGMVAGGAGTRNMRWRKFGGWNTMFKGRTDSVEPLPGDDPIANIQAFDDFERLHHMPVFTSTKAGTSIDESSDDIFLRILAAADVARGRKLPDGGAFGGLGGFYLAGAGATINTLYDRAIGGSALEALYQLQDDEGAGFVWVDGRGTIRFEPSDHRDNEPHNTYHATWETDSDDPGKPYIARDPKPRWHDGKDVIENEIFYRYNRASKSVGATVWNLQSGDDPDFDASGRTLGAYTVVDIIALDSSDQDLSNVKMPIPVTDFTIDENADGTGADWLSGAGNVEVGTVSMNSGLTQLDDTGQDFTGSWTPPGATASASRDTNIVSIKDASNNMLVAFILPTSTPTHGDPDGDGTRVTLTDWPEDYDEVGAFGTHGYIAKDAGFDETDTPLTYDIMYSAGYLIDGGVEGELSLIRYLTRGTGTPENSAFLTSAQLKADRTAGSNPLGGRALDSASVEAFGRRRVDHQTKFIDEWDVAIGRAEDRLARRKGERERFVVTMKNSTKKNLQEMLYRDVSDRVRLNYADMGISNRNYWIENYIVNISNGGKLIETTFTLSKVV